MREDIQRRYDIPQEDLDDVVAMAHKLQEEARQAPRTMGPRDVEAVASELQISPEFVDKAVEELRRRREDQKAAQRAKEATRHRLKTRAIAVGAGVLLLLAALGGAGAVGVGAAQQRAQGAESALSVVIDRQVAILPQLVALSGGDPGTLSGYEAKLKQADSVAERLEAARELSNAMAAKMGKLPPAPDAETAARKRDLQYEIVGSQNRITVEQRRYQEALGAWRSASSTPQGKLAVSLGWAKAPPK